MEIRAKEDKLCAEWIVVSVTLIQMGFSNKGSPDEFAYFLIIYIAAYSRLI